MLVKGWGEKRVGSALNARKIARDDERTMEDDFFTEGRRNDVKAALEWLEDVLVDQCRIGSNQACSPMSDTPPPMTMRRGASRVMACVKAKATALRARSMIAEEAVSPSIAA